LHGELEVFLKALKTVAEIQGGIQALSEKTGLNRQHLYRSLSPRGNPTIKTLDSILRDLGLKLTLKTVS
jgi:probable addiction module antidote protein